MAAAAARASAGSVWAGTSVRRPQSIPPSPVRTLWRQPSGVAVRTILFGMPNGGRPFLTRSRLTMELSNLVGHLAVHVGGSSAARVASPVQPPTQDLTPASSTHAHRPLPAAHTPPPTAPARTIGSEQFDRRPPGPHGQALAGLHGCVRLPGPDPSPARHVAARRLTPAPAAHAHRLPGSTRRTVPTNPGLSGPKATSAVGSVSIATHSRLPTWAAEIERSTPDGSTPVDEFFRCSTPTGATRRRRLRSPPPRLLGFSASIA